MKGMKLLIILLFPLMGLAQVATTPSGKIKYIYTLRKSLYIPGESDAIDTVYLYFNDTASNCRRLTNFLSAGEIQKNINSTIGQNADRELVKSMIREVMEKNKFREQTRLLRSNIFFSPWYDINKKQFAVLDSSLAIDWELLEDSTIILGYKCQKARCTTFAAGKMREFDAWFTTEIPLPYGPDKFYNLPGMILAVNTKYHGYYAVEIEMPLKAAEKGLVNSCTGCPVITAQQRQKLTTETINNFKELQQLNNGN